MTEPKHTDKNPDAMIVNMGMLIARLVRQVRRFDPNNSVAEQAMGYLRRVDLAPSILRETMRTQGGQKKDDGEKILAEAILAERARCENACLRYIAEKDTADRNPINVIKDVRHWIVSGSDPTERR